MSNFKVKMHQILFRLGLRPRPCWGSLQRSPRPLAGFKGPASKGGERKGGEWEGRAKGWRKGRGRGGEGEGRGGEGKGKGEWEGEGKEGTPQGLVDTPHVRNPEKYPVLHIAQYCSCKVAMLCSHLQFAAVI